MARPPAMPTQFLKQLANRPVVGNWIRYGYDTLEPEYAILVTPYNRTAICFVTPVLILHVVFAFGVCFPHVDLDV